MKAYQFITALTALSLSIAGCRSTAIIAPIPTVENPATQEITLPPPTPVYVVGAAGGEYSSSQEVLNQSESVIEQKARMQRWLDYWVEFDNRPFAWDSTQLHWKYIYDDVKDPSEVMVMLEAMGEYEGRLFTVPIGGEGFAEFPPQYDGGEIEVGFGPLELSAGAEGQWLSVEDGVPLRKNNNGEVVEKLDMQSGQWVKVEVETTSVIFSEKYPVKWSEGYTSNVGGMEIPIDIGLTYWVMNRPDEPVTEIHIADDMVDNVGEYFMRMCFWRYTQLMDHPEVTYEQYLELVAKGEGKIEVATYDESKPNQKESEINIIDPRNGFSYSMVSEKLPMNSYEASYYLGSGNEKIFLSSYVPGSYITDAKMCNYSEKICVNLLFGYMLTGTLDFIGYVKNDNDRSSVPSQFVDWQNLGVRKEMDKYLYGSRSNPPFSVFQD